MWSRACIAGLIGTRRVVMISFKEVGATPLPDRDAALNEARLRAALADDPLDVDVWSSAGGRDDDGRVRWHKPLRMLEPRDGEELAEFFLQPQVAPLEIGYTHPSRTYRHLELEGGVWRWPYGSDVLWLVAALRRKGDLAE